MPTTPQEPVTSGTRAERVVLYRAAPGTITGAPGAEATGARTGTARAPAGIASEDPVPAGARRVCGVGFTGWSWDVPAGRAARSRPAGSSTGSCAGWSVAVVPGPVMTATPRLLVMDVDSTLIRQEVIELLAAHAGREAEVAAVTEAAMRGELDFAASLHHRVQALAGLDARVIDQVADVVELQDGARELVTAFRAAGWRVGAVSGGFTQVLAPLAADLGLDHYRANVLEVEDGRLTGRVLGEVVDRLAKAEAARRWAHAAGVAREGIIAVGDGANDIDLLNQAGYGVAFCAKPALRPYAHHELDLPTLDVVRALVCP